MNAQSGTVPADMRELILRHVKGESWFKIWRDMKASGANLPLIYVLASRKIYRQYGLSDRQAVRFEMIASSSVLLVCFLLAAVTGAMSSLFASVAWLLTAVVLAEAARWFFYRCWIEVRQNNLDDIPERWS